MRPSVAAPVLFEDGYAGTYAAIVTRVHPDGETVDLIAFPPGRNPKAHKGVLAQNPDRDPQPRTWRPRDIMWPKRFRTVTEQEKQALLENAAQEAVKFVLDFLAGKRAIVISDATGTTGFTIKLEPPAPS